MWARLVGSESEVQHNGTKPVRMSALVLDLVLAGQGFAPALAMDIGHKAIGFENARITHALHNQCAERFCAKFARVSRMNFMDRTAGFGFKFQRTRLGL